MIGVSTIEQELHVSPAISSQMESSITLWSQMYKNMAPWVTEPIYGHPERVVSLGIPAMIASEKARTALIEWESEITTPTEVVEMDNPEYPEELEKDVYGNIIPTAQPKTIQIEKPTTSTDRADFLNTQYKKLKAQIRRQLEYGIAKGGLVIKPYVVENTSELGEVVFEIEFEFVQADNFYPLSFDACGRIIEAAFIQTKVDKSTVYRRLEYHKWEGNQVTVINKAFKSDNTGVSGDMLSVDLGKEVPLNSIPEWASLQPKTVIAPVMKPLFAYFKMPEANTVDTESPLGVSGFSRAKDLIKDADVQYSTLLWEYEGGSLAIDIDRDALQFESDGNGEGGSVMTKLQQRLYRKVDLGSESNTYEPFVPALRDANYIEGLNTILMRIEDVCAISRGTLSDGADVARTATELKILKQRSYQANKDIQETLETTLRDVAYIMNVYASLYQITADGEYEISFDWDDSILVDTDDELNKRITLMQNGLASKLETRMWYFGETEQQAREALMRIDEESIASMEQDLAFQNNQSNFLNNR